MKTLSLVFALVLTLTATGATARSKEYCEVGSKIAHLTATARDKGKTREESKMLLTFMGLKPETSRQFLDLAYVRFTNRSPQELKAAFFNFCMSQET